MWGSRLAPWLPSLAALIVFLPALQSGFVWDDERMFLENRRYRGLGLSELGWMWTTFHVGQYRPLAWMTLGMDYLVWGVNPAGYHLTNLLLHAVNAALAYALARRLIGRAWSAARGQHPLGLIAAAMVAALLFAVHPLRAEPVAWVSARGDLLGALLALLAILAYLTACDREDGSARRRQWLAASVLLYLASLLAKPSTLLLPIVLIVLDVYPLRRLGGQWRTRAAWPVWREKLAFLAVALPVLALALFAKADPYIQAERYRPLLRAGLAGFALVFHLVKTLLPVSLSPLYEIPPHLAVSDPRLVASALIVVAVSAGAFFLRRRWPALTAVWICYAVLLLPSSGLVPFGRQMGADRYTYLAGLGWAMLAGASVLTLKPRRALGMAIGLSAVALIAVFSVLGWNQVRIWRNTETLWAHALTINPDSGIAQNNIGTVFRRQARPAEAIVYFRRALVIIPNFPDAHYNWGNALADQGRLDEATEHFAHALRLRPDFTPAHNNWGLVLMRQGKLDDAIRHFRRALEIRPEMAEVENNWGAALATTGRYDEAIVHFRRAVELHPTFREAQGNLQVALAKRGASRPATPSDSRRRSP